mgnify:FL=1|jgi:hypothetical protein
MTRFCDYYFSTTPDSIEMDEELTLDQLGLKLGDGLVTTLDKNGTVVLKKIDLTKVEHIELTDIKIKE